MRASTLITITFSIAVALVIAGIVIVIARRKNSSISNNVFIISQSIMLAAICVAIGAMVYYGKPVDYSNPKNEYKVTKVRTTEDSYRVTLENEKTIYTNNVMYGTEMKYIDNCTLVNKTLLGFLVTDEGDLLIVQPDVEGFDDMSESKKKAVIAEWNNWNLEKQLEIIE